MQKKTMTAKEALKSIVEDGIDLGAGDYVDFDALVVAADALTKQIPQMPVSKQRMTYNGYYRYTDYYCPVCSKQQKCNFNSKRTEDGWYCERCGQKLIWRV